VCADSGQKIYRTGCYFVVVVVVVVVVAPLPRTITMADTADTGCFQNTMLA